MGESCVQAKAIIFTVYIHAYVEFKRLETCDERFFWQNEKQLWKKKKLGYTDAISCGGVINNTAPKKCFLSIVGFKFWRCREYVIHPIYLSIYLSNLLFVSIYLLFISIYQSIYPSLFISIYLSIYLSISVCSYLSIYVSIYLLPLLPVLLWYEVAPPARGRSFC